MKKLSYTLITLLMLLLVGLNPLLAQVQDTTITQDRSTKASFDRYFFLQAGLGATQFFGDINPDDYMNDRTKLMYGFGAGYQFSPVLGLRANFNNGWVVSTYEEAQRRMSSSVWDLQLDATLSLSNLIFGYKERFINLYALGGVGIANYSSMLLNTVGTDDHGDDIIVNRFGPDADAQYSQNAESNFIVPVGVGLNFRLAEKWDLNLEYNHRIMFADNLDAAPEDGGNDHYSALMLGVTYKMMAGGNLRGMEKDFDQVTFVTTPDPLVNVGDSVKVNVTVTFPPKYFGKKAAMNFQPEIAYGGTSRKLSPVNFQGEKVEGDGIVINYKEGGTYTYEDHVPYEPGMQASDLVVSPTLYLPKEPVSLNAAPEEITAKKIKIIDLPQRKLADGVIVTGTRVNHDEELIIAEHGYEKETIVSKTATIYFQVNRHNLNWNLPLNRNNQVKAQIEELVNFVKQGYVIRDIDINAWASPEGEESFNQGLSERRAQTGKKQVIDMFKKMAKEKNATIVIKNPEDSLYFNSYANGEDWNGFMQAVEASNLADKRIIMNVVNSQSDVTRREQEIRNMATVYREIEEDILPPLRRVEIKINCFEPKKTDEEIANLATSDASQLDEKELLYAATLTEDLATKTRIYQNATTRFPNDWRGFNNLAVVSMWNNQLGEAESSISKANQLEPNNGIILNNQGALESKKTNYNEAAEIYQKAKSLGINVDYNLGITHLAKSRYDQALSLMGNRKCNTNVALAQIMTNRLEEANTTLSCAPESAHNYYMMAVVGARNGDTNMMTTNLSKAISIDPTLKAQAAEDREFIKYFESPEFTNIVK